MKKIACAVLLAILAASASSSWSAESQKTFSTPKDALAAVVQACADNDTNALLSVFGAEGKDIVESGDPSDDKDRRAEFVVLTKQKTKFIQDPANPDKMILSIGKEDWPFPIPLVRRNGLWSFDSAEGRQEILARRIGSNEMSGIEICRGFVEAQFEYAQDHKKNGIPEYARQIVSSPGKQDGLYWDSTPGAPECQVPKGFAQAVVGMSLENKEPYHGYYFRLLTSQGPDAHGGAMSYMVNGSMIGGFALVAWPAEYGVSGVQTFIVNHDGAVYESDLGPETVRQGAEMSEFNPDKTWRPVQ